MQPRDTSRGDAVELPVTVLRRAAETYGTPLFVMSERAINDAAAQCETAFPAPWLLHYSLKANDLPGVARLLFRRGWGASVVSVGEWAQARAAGFAEQDTVFEGIGKSDAQIEDVVTASAAGRSLRWLVAESADEIVILRSCATSAGLGSGGRPALDVLLRLNPDVEPDTETSLAVGAGWSKFGMPRDEILELSRDGLFDCEALVLRGVHVHTGSQLASVEAWAKAGAAALSLWTELNQLHACCDTVDFGGGFPSPSPQHPSPKEFRAALERVWPLDDGERPDRCALEPGRFLVGSAGWLVARVLHTRPRPGGAQIVLDAGMTELVRPALYGAHHPISALSNRDAAVRTTSVEGPVCENTDSFGTYELPPLRRGDLVAIGEAGAYAASFSSRYNGRPLPVELMWTDADLLRSSERVPIPPHRPPTTQAPDATPSPPQ